MTSAFIRDGFTLEGKVEARPGLYPEIRFTYRPALPRRVAEYLKADKGTPEKEQRADTKLLLEHVQSWDAHDENGQQLSFDEATLTRVYHPILQTLLNHVTGYTATDWQVQEKNC